MPVMTVHPSFGVGAVRAFVAPQIHTPAQVGPAHLALESGETTAHQSRARSVVASPWSHVTDAAPGLDIATPSDAPAGSTPVTCHPLLATRIARDPVPQPMSSTLANTAIGVLIHQGILRMIRRLLPARGYTWTARSTRRAGGMR